MRSPNRVFLGGSSVAILLAGVLISCTGGSDGGRLTRLEIYLTDAPANFDQVWVTVDDVEAHRSGGKWFDIPLTGTPQDTNQDGANDIIPNPDGSVTIDLLALRNVEALFASGVIDPGHYTMIRLKVLSAEAVDGGSTIPMEVPSGARTGIKINVTFDVEQGQLVTLLLDFDAEKSIVERGGSGKPPLLKPVLRMVSPEVVVAATITPGDSPTSLGYSPDGSLIAVANSGDGTVTLIETTNYQVVATIPTEPDPSFVKFSPSGELLLVASAGTPKSPRDKVTPIDVPNLVALPAVQVGLMPSVIEFRPDGGSAYVLARSAIQPSISVIDAGSLNVVQTINLGAIPHSVAFSDDSLRAVVTTLSSQSVHVINAMTHNELPAVQLPGIPAGAFFRAGTHTAVVANSGPGPAVSFIDADSSVATPAKSGAGAGSFIVPGIQQGITPCYLVLTNERDSLRVMDLDDGSPMTGFILSRDHSPDIQADMGPPVLVNAMVGNEEVVVGAAAGGNLVLFGIGTSPSIKGHLRLGGEIQSMDADPMGERVAVLANDVVSVVNLANIPAIQLILPDYPLILPPILINIPIAGDTCVGNVAVLVDDGLNSAATSLVQDQGFTWAGDGQRVVQSLTFNAVSRFYGVMDDIYDYVIVFYGSDWRALNSPFDGNPINIWPETGNAFHQWLKNYTTGIGDNHVPGDRWGNQAPGFGIPSQRLQSMINMNDLGEYDGAFNAFGGRPGISIFAQEIGHRFASFADMLAPEGPILRNNAHWHRAFNTFASAIGGNGGNLIADIGGGQFQITAKENTFSPWDEYLCGFVGPTVPPDSFRVGNPSRVSSFNNPYLVGEIITGNRVNVPFADFLTDNGTRIPNSNLSQKVFHIGVALVVPGNSVRQADLNEVGAMMGAMADFMETETDGRAYLTVQNCPTIYTTKVADINVGGSPCNAAILPDGSKLYVPNLFDDTVSVIDTDPSSASFHTVIATINVGDRPTSIGFRPDGSRGYVTSDTDLEVTIIDTASDTVAGTIPVGEGTASIAVGTVGPAANRAYVLNSVDNDIDVINVLTETVVDSFPTGDQGGSLATDMAISGDGEVLVFTNRADDTVTAHGLVTSAETTLNTGAGPIGVEIVQFESMSQNTVARSQASASPPALVYVSAATDFHLRVFDLVTDPSTNAFTFRRLPTNPDMAGPPNVPDIVVSDSPIDPAFHPGGSLAVVPVRDTDEFALVQTADHTVIDTVSLAAGALPIDIVISRDGSTAYVIQEGNNRVGVYR